MVSVALGAFLIKNCRLIQMQMLLNLSTYMIVKIMILCQTWEVIPQKQVDFRSSVLYYGSPHYSTVDKPSVYTEKYPYCIGQWVNAEARMFPQLCR